MAAIMDVRCTFQSLVALLVAALVVGAIYLTAEGGYLVQEDDQNVNEKNSNESSSSTTSSNGCDLFSGKWTFDNKSYPLYKEEECTFMSDQLACGKFNATALLERLRNKRLVFVGDSLNRGQWVSMVCLLDKAIPRGRKYMHNNGSSLITFKAKDYNAKIEFYWAPLLVESNSDDPVNHRLPDRIVRAQAIEKHARHWTDADILVFNTYLWWRRPQMNILWGSFENSDGIYKKVDMLRSYEMALKTWSDWLEIHVNRTKTQLFFMSMSPTHERAGEWGKSREGNCYNETELISEEGYQGRGTDPKMMHLVETMIDELQKRELNVQLINITQLSEYRKEGHPSIYRKQWEPLTEEQISNPLGYADCKWVYDNKSYPLYKEQQCSFLPGDLTCQKNGRKDLNYQNWRWQPHDCDLPRYNASAFLEKIRGKRLVFVGDSLNRNQWMSMLCLIESKIPPSSQLLINQHNLSIPIPEYNTTIEFYWSPMLVESDCDDPSHHNARNRTARIESIENHARHWTDADILVFDSYAWWLDQTITLLWGSFGSPDAVYKKITMKLRPFEMAMKTWSEWLEFNINQTKTTMFFMSMSPFHAFGEEWGSTKGENCYGETEQILQQKEQSWGSLINREMMQIAESAIDELEKRGVKVQYLNITHLSALRKEGHPSIYRDYPIPPSKEQLANPSSYADCFILITLVAITVYLRREIDWNIVREQINSLKQEQTAHDVDDSSPHCDYFSGSWVFDNVSHPLYTENECSFIEDFVACEKHGRKDSKYQRWRWQPDHCDIPRFNGRALLEKLRGKRLIFVGDSLDRNQWISLLCLIESSLSPSSNKALILRGNLYYFQDNEYNTTIGFYWSPFLVESNCDDVKDHRIKGRVIKVNSIEKHAKIWIDADILILNSFAWWMAPLKSVMGSSFNTSDAIYVDKLLYYEMALTTLSDWLGINLNRTKTRLFFMGASPYPQRGDDLRQCYNKTEPIPGEGFSIASNKNMIRIQESLVQKLKTKGIKAEYFPITEMSEMRRDAHLSIYRTFYEPLTEENIKDPRTYADCLHWCLPGVPDVWNQIVYAYIMNS
ncbi:hypothetical protein BUALT_Bualt09G0129900 [Buddleja alternifolia]|uniref:Trichome birefringence-like N-terminal domain-containing protein n=1 Tax=Buddleja alternifolia TaxID=168488 RepID=A0AAV6X289_9LAMI|nr:hypothetical protein BUALT_Bualt09G0129900 [Buddleja alternifolia]